MAKVEYNRALHLYPKKESEWVPKVLLCSALKNEGINTIWETIEAYITLTKANNHFDKKRQEQNKFWLIQTIEEQLKSNFFKNNTIKKALEEQLKLIESNQTTPFVAADYLLKLKKDL